MMEEDVVENTEWCSDFISGVVDCPENLSFSLESLYKILDEEPAPTNLNSLCIPENSHLEKLDFQMDHEVLYTQPDKEIHLAHWWFQGIPESSHLQKLDFQRDHKALHPQSESRPSEVGNQNSLNGSQRNELLSGPPFPHNGTSNHLNAPCYDESLDERNCSTSQHDSHVDLFGDFVTDDANSHALQVNTTNCSYYPGNADNFCFSYPQHINFTTYTDMDGPKENSEILNSETSLHNSIGKSITGLNRISSPCMLQKGETSLISNMMIENYGSTKEGGFDLNRGALPRSLVQSESIHTSSVACTAEDPSLLQQYKFSPEINCDESINDSHDANYSSLTVPEDFSFSAEATDLPHDKVILLHGQDREGAPLFVPRDSFKCIMQEMLMPPHSSILDDPVVDMDKMLCHGLCTQQCYCGDMGIMSESSTDSSPLPYDHKPIVLELDGSSTKNRQLIFDHKMVLQRDELKSFLKEKKQPQISTNLQQQHRVLGVPKNASPSNPSRRNSTLDDDTDLFILDDISDPVPPAPLPAPVNSLPMTLGFRDYHAGSGALRTRSDDERLTFQLALQDISQPKAEASPPDGVLAVPLLRHQRIALSWMIQKETAGLNCSGGILADDQGLGKTITTIALILTEKSRSSVIRKKCEFEPLNLDDEDDGGGCMVFESNMNEQLLDFGPSTHVKPEKVDCSLVSVKGRPAAGTLVVCPTSVLRQWADELQTKITNKAKFSFLVYHGSNRTKDPYELAKYDVVVTTYAIISMEVPKQPLVDKDETEKGKHNGCILGGNLTSNKRKERPSTSSKKSMQKITSHNSVLEFASGPLARVGWFRVILDEAQSIKNHRTQVARACWGLRAKRRWCLSGTPIQNAIDDLYSYFRFLRYDPYAVYKYFCSTIKLPISRNPANGYKKLQAVLKTVMLRRTKGTFLDGKPIITLPPKTVTLKRVDFSVEEFEFYSALEAESCKQFKVYAAAGTVKKNYVNILLMLLRLRQACDHPVLVKGHDLSSVSKSSLDSAKKLPKDKIMNLLNCLEACLAICTICNDPPEEAVVSICGHVFCNQCICEHLTGDDSICPSVICRNKLSPDSVFSMDTLRRCLWEHTRLGFCSDSSISDVEHGSNISQGSYCSSSSKIRAALEILHSLPMSKTSPSLCERAKPYVESSVLLENTVDTISLGCSSDTATCQQSNIKDSNVMHPEKAIIFSQWTRMLDLLEISLKDSSILYRRLDGTMSVGSREKAIKDFNELPEVTVIIMSLKAASLGLNMVAACHVVLLDLWWNPTTEDQAIDRAHRIGQTRPVTVSRLTVKGTVEDRILSLQEKKRKLVASAFGEDESGSRQTRLTVADLKYLFMG